MSVEITEVKVLRVQPGDIVVVELGDRVPPEELARVNEMVRDAIGFDTPVFVLDEGSTIGVLRKETL